MRSDSGVAATELAIVMPVMIVVVMLVFQVALFWHAKQSADVAAEEAVDAAQLDTATEADGHAGAAAILGQAGNLRNAEVTVTRDTATGVVTATVTGQAPAIVPFGTWRVSAQAQGSIEQFVPAGDR
jgi:Flp pilus assembly protein TadG